MITRHAVLATVVAQYDGTNAQDIIDAAGPQMTNQGWSATLVSETGGVATIDMDNTINVQRTTLNADDWVPINPFGGFVAIADSPNGGVWAFPAEGE